MKNIEIALDESGQIVLWQVKENGDIVEEWRRHGDFTITHRHFWDISDETLTTVRQMLMFVLEKDFQENQFI